MSKLDINSESKPETKPDSKKENDDFDWETKTWDVIDTFFKQDNILIEHHLTKILGMKIYKFI